jgi:hypothetical protein
MTEEDDGDWELSNEYAQSNKFKKYGKRHPDETASCLVNLDSIQQILKDGNALGTKLFPSFFRPEATTGGAYRIGQTGVKGAKESRLYVFPCPHTKVIYILTIGDKDEQKRDLSWVRETVAQIKKDKIESIE